MRLNTTQELIEDIRQGRMIVLMDDQARENEGDLVLAAAHTTADHVNFMALHGRGLICLTLTEQDCRRLNLPLMSNRGFSYHGTNFTVSIEAASGVTTGISAADRARTICTAVDPRTGPADLHQPGHVFPLMAHPGGVLVRAGHTEAGCDLARLAELHPSAVIVEVLNEDGTMARRPELEAFAAHHRLKIGTIADLIHFRMQHEKTVERVSVAPVTTEYGEFLLYVYKDGVGKDVHIALVSGDIDPGRPVLVRVHLHHPISDLVGLARHGRTLRETLESIGREGGVAVILCNQVSNTELISYVDVLHRIHDQGAGQDPEPETRELRTIGLGAQILVDLGVRRMRVMSSPKKMHALDGFGLEVVEYVG